MGNQLSSVCNRRRVQEDPYKSSYLQDLTHRFRAMTSNQISQAGILFTTRDRPSQRALIDFSFRNRPETVDRKLNLPGVPFPGFRPVGTASSVNPVPIEPPVPFAAPMQLEDVPDLPLHEIPDDILERLYQSDLAELVVSQLIPVRIRRTINCPTTNERVRRTLARSFYYRDRQRLIRDGRFLTDVWETLNEKGKTVFSSGQKRYISDLITRVERG